MTRPLAFSLIVACSAATGAAAGDDLATTQGAEPGPVARADSTAALSTGRSTPAWTSTPSPAGLAQGQPDSPRPDALGPLQRAGRAQSPGAPRHPREGEGPRRRAFAHRSQGRRLLRRLHGRAGHRGQGPGAAPPALGRVDAVDVEEGPLPAAGRARRPRRSPRSSASAPPPTCTTREQTIAEPGPGRPRPARSRRLPERRRQVEGEARQVRGARGAHAARLADASAEPAKADAAAVLRVETALANVHLSRVEMRDPKNRDNPMTLAELQALAPAFEWGEYFPATGAPAFTTAQRRPAGSTSPGGTRPSRPTPWTTGRPTCAGT